MIQFEKWLMLKITEGIDRWANLPLDKIELQEIGVENGYEAYFYYGQDKFKAELNRMPSSPSWIDDISITSTEKIPVQNFFTIRFYGPTGETTSGTQSVSAAMTIYRYLLAVIKKVFQAEDAKGRTINGFSFIPREMSMMPVYEQFYKTYLRPLGYVRVTDSLYVKNSWLKQGLATKSAEEKTRVAQSMNKHKLYVAADIELAKRNKIRNRNSFAGRKQ